MLRRRRSAMRARLRRWMTAASPRMSGEGAADEVRAFIKVKDKNTDFTLLKTFGLFVNSRGQR